MTKVLFLDDMQARADVMRTKFQKLRHVTTSKIAIQLLYTDSYDLVCLDYDLDLATPGDFGMNVVDWLTDSKRKSETFFPELREAEYVVHSTNLLMGTKMVRKLLESGYSAHYVPFSYLMGGPFNK